MLKKEELMQVKGGSLRWVLIGIGGVLVSFLIGIFDGYHRPLACNK